MYRKLRVFVRHRLDVSVRDLLHGLRAYIQTPDRKETTERILKTTSLEDTGMVCLSVRTGFDLLLEALDWPVGGEVIVSAITHPDMVRIIQAHGLHPVPIDVSPETLAPVPGSLEAARTPRTKAVLVTHLFGGKMDIEMVSEFTEKHDLLLFEDCAQAFQGPEKLQSGTSDASMYSFGPLKTATALGGALLCINDAKLLSRMRSIEGGYKEQAGSEYGIRLLKYLVLVLFSRPVPYGLLVHACRLVRGDLDTLLSNLSHAFPSGSYRQLLRRVRRRPCVPLLALLSHRLENFDYKRLARRALFGERAALLLEPHATLPGLRSRDRTHWILPVVPSRPDDLVLALKDHGFDASPATSNLVAVEPPPEDPSPHKANLIMSNIVFLPVYPELPEGALELLAAVVAESAT